MRFGVVYDASSEAGLGETLFGIRTALGEYFADRFYDDSAIEMFVVLMCRDPEWRFKQRIRFAKKENCLYMDLMLDLPIMASADPIERKRIVGEKIVNEVPEIVARKKFRDFDLRRFSLDLRDWFEEHGWIPRVSASSGDGL